MRMEGCPQESNLYAKHWLGGDNPTFIQVLSKDFRLRFTISHISCIADLSIGLIWLVRIIWLDVYIDVNNRTYSTM